MLHNQPLKRTDAAEYPCGKRHTARPGLTGVHEEWNSLPASAQRLAKIAASRYRVQPQLLNRPGVRPAAFNPAAVLSEIKREIIRVIRT